MCTASWLTDGASLHFLFNRDERTSRAVGLPPQLRQAEGVPYLAPIDPDSGGTWFAVTERGLLLALLNRSVGEAPASAGKRSRGTLIPELAAASGRSDLTRRIGGLALSECAPFRLVAQLADGAALGAVWTGSGLEVQELDPASGLLCSSSLGDLEATRSRSLLWSARRLQLAADGLGELRRFHRSHLPQRSALSVCMHRDDAETVSHLEVQRDRETFRVAYYAGSPCRTLDPSVATLPFSRASRTARS